MRLIKQADGTYALLEIGVPDLARIQTGLMLSGLPALSADPDELATVCPCHGATRYLPDSATSFTGSRAGPAPLPSLSAAAGTWTSPTT